MKFGPNFSGLGPHFTSVNEVAFGIIFFGLLVLVPSGMVEVGSVLARLCLVWDVDEVWVIILSLSRSLELSNDCGMEQ